MSTHPFLVLADRTLAARFATAAEAAACVERLRRTGRYGTVGSIDLSR